MESSGAKTVLVFGDTGSGKSSLINLFKSLDQDEIEAETQENLGLKTDLSFQSELTKSYNFLEISPLTNSRRIGKCSKLSNARKIAKYIQLNGVHLLVLVVRKGRLTRTIEENYNIIANSICLRKVPLLLVISHCENEQQPGKWWELNESVFQNQGMYFEDGISTCLAAPGENIQSIFKQLMSEAYARSKVSLPQAFEQFGLEEAWKPSFWQRTKSWFKCFYNVFFSAAISSGEKGFRKASKRTRSSRNGDDLGESSSLLA